MENSISNAINQFSIVLSERKWMKKELRLDMFFVNTQFTIAIFKGVPTTPFDSSRTHAWAYHGPYTSLPLYMAMVEIIPLIQYLASFLLRLLLYCIIKPQSRHIQCSTWISPTICLGILHVTSGDLQSGHILFARMNGAMLSIK